MIGFGVSGLVRSFVRIDALGFGFWALAFSFRFVSASFFNLKNRIIRRDKHTYIYRRRYYKGSRMTQGCNPTGVLCTLNTQIKVSAMATIL